MFKIAYNITIIVINNYFFNILIIKNYVQLYRSGIVFNIKIKVDKLCKERDCFPVLFFSDSRCIVPLHSDIKQRIFHVELDLVLSGCRLMTVITMMRCFLRPWVSSTHAAARQGKRTRVGPCVYTHEWYFVCTICIRPVCNDLRTSTRVRFINAFRVGLDRQRNEKFLNDVRSNATLFAFLFILYYANCILSELYDMCIVL